MTSRIACLVLAAVSLPGTMAAAGPSDTEIAAAIAAYAQELHDAGQFSGVILVAREGKTVLERAHGFADLEAKVRNTPDTAFNVGSINKQFTKVAIAQLERAGKLSLDDTIREHLPELRIPGAERITIRQLLDHRSGLGDIFGPRYDAAPPARLRELADFVPLFAGEPLGFEPGTSRRYSNAGYIVLGLIVERASGQTYRDHVARHIFGPAGMTRSGFWGVDEPVAHRATGYTGRGAARVSNRPSLPGRPSSAGGAYATARDLLRFVDAQSSGKLPSVGLASVAGGAPGVNAAILREGPWTVIVLANLDPPSASALARGSMDLIRAR
jgi:CubicO group peptidase (beta-lactamase class C family)